MHCPFCGKTDTRVIDSRLRGDGSFIRRRRECGNCNSRFNTDERPELKLPNIIKADGGREIFDLDKLRGGMLRALQKRPVSTDAVEESIQRIVTALRNTDGAEISSRVVGEHIMEELSKLDQVAYVRFASVYRRFEDVQAFREVIEVLEREADNLDTKTRQLSLLEGGKSEPKRLRRPK